jgi:peroxiredoxin family protein
MKTPTAKHFQPKEEYAPRITSVVTIVIASAKAKKLLLPFFISWLAIFRGKNREIFARFNAGKIFHLF